MIRPPTRSTRTYTRFPYTTLFRSPRPAHAQCRPAFHAARWRRLRHAGWLEFVPERPCRAVLGPGGRRLDPELARWTALRDLGPGRRLPAARLSEIGRAHV